jgi:hypothetical protein
MSAILSSLDGARSASFVRPYTGLRRGAKATPVQPFVRYGLPFALGVG